MSGGGGTDTATRQAILPQWYSSFLEDTATRARGVAETPYQAYTGERVAPLTGAQQTAIGQISALQPSADYGTARTALGSLAQYQAPTIAAPAPLTAETVSAPTFLQGDVSAYMNPYLREVEERALSAQERAFGANLSRIGSQAARVPGGYGGSRQALAEGVAAAEAARGMGDLSAQLRAQGFGQAAGLMQADQARAMQAALANQVMGLQAATTTGARELEAARANQAAALQAAQQRQAAAQLLPGVSAAEQDAALARAAALMGAGATQQAQQQRAYDIAYSDWLAQQQAPTRALNVMLSAAGGLPVQPDITTTQPSNEASTWLQGIGATGALLGGAGQLVRAFR